VNGTDAPLDMVKDPRACDPTAPPTVPAAIWQVSLMDPAPAVTATYAGTPVPAFATPAICMLQAVGVALDDPVFWRFTTQWALAADVQVTAIADT